MSPCGILKSRSVRWRAWDGAGLEHLTLSIEAGQVIAAVGLAILVLVANAGANGLFGEELRIAMAEGIRRAAFTIACGIGMTLVIALNLRTVPDVARSRPVSP
jgi:hypothetical protein